MPISFGADLVVVGTQGRTRLANLFVGTVARKVMAGAKCPVVTVNIPAQHKVGSWHDPVIPIAAENRCQSAS